MHIIALTGNIASGKSSVAQLLREWGAVLFDADEVVRIIQRPGEPVFAEIMARFGEGVRRADGGLDRAALRELILTDPLARADLEAMTHPVVEVYRQEAILAARAGGATVFVADVPLLYEAADPSVYDGVILVDAPEAIRRQRLIHDRGLPSEIADRLMAAQMPSSRKRPRATWIIDNDTDRGALVERTRDVWQAISA